MLEARLIDCFIAYSEELKGLHQGLDLLELCSQGLDRRGRVVECRVSELDDLIERHCIAIQKGTIRLFFEAFNRTLGFLAWFCWYEIDRPLFCFCFCFVVGDQDDQELKRDKKEEKGEHTASLEVPESAIK